MTFRHQRNESRTSFEKPLATEPFADWRPLNYKHEACTSVTVDEWVMLARANPEKTEQDEGESSVESSGDDGLKEEGTNRLIKR